MNDLQQSIKDMMRNSPIQPTKEQRKLERLYCDLWLLCGKDDAKAKAAVDRACDGLYGLTPRERLEWTLRIERAGGWDAFWLAWAKAHNLA